MTVSIPHRIGVGTDTNSVQFATYVKEKKNDFSSWNDGVERRTHLYPRYSWNRDAPRKSSIDASGWRKCLPYQNSGSSWSYTDGRYASEWYKTGYPNNEMARDVYTGVDGGGVHFGDLAVPWPDSEIDNITQMAKTECMNKLSEGKVNLGQMIAESRQIAETLADASVGLIEPIRDIKRGRIDLVPKHLGLVRRKASGWYLQWQYGWKPLCSDLYGIHQALTGNLSKPHILSATRSVTCSSSGKYSQYGIDATYKTNNRVTCKVWATVSQAKLAQAASYGLVNPLSLSWEVIPYSFVLDWFTPIGNTLQSLSATAGLDFKDGCISTTREGTVSFKMPNSGSCSRSMFRFNRDVPPTWPSTWRPYWSPQPFKLQRLANLTMLLSQAKL